jgi:hypothetical protein
VAGGVALGAGVVTAVGGGLLLGATYLVFQDAQKAAQQNDQSKVSADRSLGEPLQTAGVVVLGVGVVAAAVGAVLLIAD